MESWNIGLTITFLGFLTLFHRSSIPLFQLFYSFTLLKNFLNLPKLFNLMTQKTQFPPSEHDRTKLGILEGLTKREIILHDQLEFMDTAPFSNRIEKDLSKFYHPFFADGNLCLKSQFSQGVHDLGNIDLFRTAHGTGLAGGADPDRRTSKQSVLIIDLDQTENLIRLNIHLR